MPSVKRQCEMCGASFEAKRRDKRTCGAACQKALQRRKRKNLQTIRQLDEMRSDSVDEAELDEAESFGVDGSMDEFESAEWQAFVDSLSQAERRVVLRELPDSETDKRFWLQDAIEREEFAERFAETGLVPPTWIRDSDSGLVVVRDSEAFKREFPDIRVWETD